MQLRPYRSQDCAALAALFHKTIHTVNARDYAPEQLDAWADGAPDLDRWNGSLLAHHSLVAVEGRDLIVGFGDIDGTGYLDRLYVHKDRQGLGIATALCDRLERAVDAPVLTTHASITARPFFEARSYRARCARQVERDGVTLVNFAMEKKL